MSDKPKSRLPLLLGIVGVLGLVVWWDRSGEPAPSEAPVAAIRRPAAAEGPSSRGGDGQRSRATAAARLSHPLGELPLNSLGETLSRPLFEPTRRAPAVARPAPAAPPPPAPTRQLAGLSHRLLGVVLSPEGAVAVLAQDNGRSVRAEVGDSVDGWQVVRITRDAVHFTREGRQQVLTVTRK